MTKGDVINGYTVMRDFTTAGGGLSKWTFATKGSREFFLKEFLSPTYPTSDSPGSARLKKEKLARCQDFERHHHALMERLSSRSRVGGNLMITVDFFRHGPRYYKVTEKVDVKGLPVSTIASSTWETKRLVLLTVSHSIGILHDLDIVHGDLKPDNILIKLSDRGNYVAKLIDFDNSYASGDAPRAADEMVGDMVYYSPELLRYVKDGSEKHRKVLSLRSDIFALGLIYMQFLTGRLPTFDVHKFQYPCVASANGRKLTAKGTTVPEHLVGLIDRMMATDPAERPTIGQVFATVKSGAAPVESPVPTLKGTLIKRAAEPVARPAAPPVTATGLTGTLAGRKRH